MTVYTAECAIDSADTITATRSSNRVELEPSSRTEVYLDPDDARTFARGILALADEIDGGEAKEEAPAPARAPQIGDKVRILKDDPYTQAGEFVGRTGVLRAVKDGVRTVPYRVRLDDPSGTWDDGSWWVAEVELVDEPAEPLADWERDLMGVTTSSPFAAHITEAKRLLTDTDHTGADVIRLAEILSAQ